jgi:hypothetical protein
MSTVFDFALSDSVGRQVAQSAEARDGRPKISIAAATDRRPPVISTPHRRAIRAKHGAGTTTDDVRPYDDDVRLYIEIPILLLISVK